jgi:hypothetical protein
MKKKNTRSIWIVILEYILIAPILGICFQCMGISWAVLNNAVLGLVPILVVYITLALFIVDARKISPNYIPIFMYRAVVGVLFVVSFITAGFYVYLGSIPKFDYATGDFAEFGRAIYMIGSSCIFGPLSGLIAIFVTQIMRVRRLRQDDPFESADSGNS